MALLWNWAVIAAVCAVLCAAARLVGHHMDDAEARRSRRQWQVMCEALGAEDFTADHPGQHSTPSATRAEPAPPAREPIPTEAMR